MMMMMMICPLLLLAPSLPTSKEHLTSIP